MARFNRSKVHRGVTISLRFGRSITLFSTRKNKTERKQNECFFNCECYTCERSAVLSWIFCNRLCWVRKRKLTDSIIDSIKHIFSQVGVTFPVAAEIQLHPVKNWKVLCSCQCNRMSDLGCDWKVTGCPPTWLTMCLILSIIGSLGFRFRTQQSLLQKIQERT